MAALNQGSIKDDTSTKYKQFAVGDIVETCNYGPVEIVSIPSSTEATVRFIETGCIVNTRPSELVTGYIKDHLSNKFVPKIKSTNRFCVYTHKDLYGKVRYVGQGTEQRAYIFTGRNDEWNSLFSEQNPPIVDIIKTELTKEEAFRLEFDTINKYKDTVVNKIKAKHEPKDMLFDDFHRNFIYDETSPTCLMRKTKNGTLVVAGFKTENYYKVSLNNSSYGVHRVVWLLHHGSIDKTMVVDHINGDSLNNCIENLRLVSHSLNSKNRDTRIPKSGFRNILEEYNRSGKFLGYRVAWTKPMHNRKSSKSFRISKYDFSSEKALLAAYNFRDSLIENGELLHRIKEGEVTIE